jgi:hypothetical protein
METNQEPQSGQEEKKGNKLGLIIIAVIVLLLAGWYFLKSSNKTELKSSTQNKQTAAAENSPMSLKELMMGKTQKCEVGLDSQNTQTQGTVYISGGKMRGDFKSQVNGKTEITHMINDGKTQFVWTEGSSEMAFKISLEALQQNSQDTTQAQNQTFDLETKRDYNCTSWTEDSSSFSVPTNIKFTDYSEMMKSVQTAPASGGTGVKGGASGSVDVKAMQCAACNSLSGEEQTQCKAALSCK